MDNPNTEFPIITVEVAGQKVTGLINFHSKRNISVVIEIPYKNVSRSLHSPHFSRRLFEGEYSDSTAVALLTSIYEICEFAKKSKEVLLEKLAVKKIENQIIEEVILSLNQKKVDLKCQFKSGHITNIQYQQHLKKIKTEIQNKEWDIHKLWGDYFDFFPEIIPIEMRREIVKFIESLN